MELIYGIGKRGSKTLSTAVQSFMSDMTIVPFDQAAAQRAGVLRAVLERMGVALSLADGQIAGHALALDMTLVSADADFKKMSGLKVKDWSKY